MFPITKYTQQSILSFWLPPINLWSKPHQDIDYKYKENCIKKDTSKHFASLSSEERREFISTMVTVGLAIENNSPYKFIIMRASDESTGKLSEVYLEMLDYSHEELDQLISKFIKS